MFSSFLPAFESNRRLIGQWWQTWREQQLHARLSSQKNFPSSFTICTAFMVKAWAKYASGVILVIRDDKGTIWFWEKIRSTKTYTEFSFQFGDSPYVSNKSKILFYPLQWTRLCLAKDAYTSKARLVVDGELLIETEVKVEDNPDDLNLALGIKRSNIEYTGQTTDLNIFSFAKRGVGVAAILVRFIFIVQWEVKSLQSRAEWNWTILLLIYGISALCCFSWH